MIYLKTTRIIFLGILCLSLFFETGCAHKGKVVENKKRYTAYNIWHQKNGAWFINFKEGAMIPAGTEVTNISIKYGHCKFTTAEDGKTYGIRFCYRLHPGLISYDYMKKTFTERSFKDLTMGMENDEIKAIKAGKIVEGMSKNSVIVSHGYPPEHTTDDFNSDTWLYWTNQHAPKKICFDENGKTIGCSGSKKIL